jgi:hypothetical protein
VINYWTAAGAYLPATTDSDVQLGGTGDWTAVDVVATAPVGAAYVRVELRLAGSGTAWFDDLLVQQV